MSLADLSVAILVLVIIVLPERASYIAHAYEPEPELTRDIALAQAELAIDPGNSEAAHRLAGLLTEARQTDWALQVAGSAAKRAKRVSWRALLAISTTHAERIDVVDAHHYAKLALEACLSAGPKRCPPHERARMSLYFDQLDFGVKSGIDPRADPIGYQRAVAAAMRIIRFRGAPPARDDRDNRDSRDNRDNKVDAQNGADEGRKTPRQSAEPADINK